MSAQPPQYNNNEIDLKLQYLEAVNQNLFEQIAQSLRNHYRNQSSVCHPTL